MTVDGTELTPSPSRRLGTQFWRSRGFICCRVGLGISRTRRATEVFMPNVFESVTVNDEYRVSWTAEGLRIEVLDYHAKPLVLDRPTLCRLGLRVTDEESHELG